MKQNKTKTNKTSQNNRHVCVIYNKYEANCSKHNMI